VGKNDLGNEVMSENTLVYVDSKQSKFLSEIESFFSLGCNYLSITHFVIKQEFIISTTLSLKL